MTTTTKAPCRALQHAYAERQASYDAAKDRAYAVETWGPYEVLIFRWAAHTRDVYEGFASKTVRRRYPTRWRAAAYDGTRRAYGARELWHSSRKEALEKLRVDMRTMLDRLPERIEFLEAEERRLREALYR